MTTKEFLKTLEELARETSKNYAESRCYKLATDYEERAYLLWQIRYYMENETKKKSFIEYSKELRDISLENNRKEVK